MKRILLLICSIALATSLHAQQIKVQPAVFDDFRTLLEMSGYEAFSFDLRELLGRDERYDIVLSIREYADGRQIGEQRFNFGENVMLLSDFPEESRKEIADEDMADAAKGIFKQAEKLIIGQYPSGVDSLAKWMFCIPELGQMASPLKLRNAAPAQSERPFYGYSSRPFKTDTFEAGKFIPLLFFGSMWYDERGGMYRFCGETEIAPDLSSEIVGNVPHFYVIGIELSPIKTKP